MGMLTLIGIVVLLVLAAVVGLIVLLVVYSGRSTVGPLPRRIGTCPGCGRALPEDAPQGLCPACLLQAGLSSREQVQPAGKPAGEPAPTLSPPNVHEQSTASGHPPPAPPFQRGGEKGHHGPFVAPEPAELTPLFPQLEVIEMLGRGGMGAVYKCRQPHLDRLVALKILPPESGQDPAFAERFMREARALAKLNHPNIVGVYDFGIAAPSPSTGEGRGGYYYFLMEYVEGANLRQIIRGGKLKPAEALKIVPQICDALQFAHDESIVHRDIKPENILVDKRGRVKIADFGLAKLVGPSALESGLTGTMQVMGTLYYMAPEQMERPKEVDHRADIYSLGVVFYELLTGQLPVGNFPRPSQKVQVDVRLDEVVLRALEHEPQQRYQHASDVKTEVEAINSGSPLAASRPVSFARATPQAADSARHRIAAPAISLMVVGALQCLLVLLPLLAVGAAAILAQGPGSMTDGVASLGLIAGVPLQNRPPGQAEAMGSAPMWWLLVVGSLVVGNLPGIGILIGAIQMYRLQSYGLAVAASILAMLPFGPVFLLGLPIGLWALLTLRRPDVSAAFGTKSESAPGLAVTSDHPSPSHGVAPRPSGPAAIPLDVVQRRLRGPAGGLLITGLVTVLFALTCILWSGWQLARSMSAPTEPQKSQQGGMTVTMTPKKAELPNQGLVIGLLASQVMALATGALMLLAVLAMRKVEYHHLALLGSSVAMIPLSPSWVLGFPVGIWANLVLRRPGVRVVFERPVTQEDETAVDAAQQVAWLREWFGTATGWAMIVALLGAATAFLPWARVTIFGITTTTAGFDTWHGIVSGCMFVGAFLALVAINYVKPIGLLRAAASAAAGATAIICVWAFLAEMSKEPEMSKPTGTGDPALMNAFADLFKDMFTSNIQMTVLSGPYVMLGFGIALGVLCLWQVGEVVVRGMSKSESL